MLLWVGETDAGARLDCAGRADAAGAGRRRLEEVEHLGEEVDQEPRNKRQSDQVARRQKRYMEKRFPNRG